MFKNISIKKIENGWVLKDDNGVLVNDVGFSSRKSAAIVKRVIEADGENYFADFVEVVRCKDCHHCVDKRKFFGHCMLRRCKTALDAFCSDANEPKKNTKNITKTY